MDEVLRVLEEWQARGDKLCLQSENGIEPPKTNFGLISVIHPLEYQPQAVYLSACGWEETIYAEMVCSADYENGIHWQRADGRINRSLKLAGAVR